MIWLWIKSLRDKLRKPTSIPHTYDIGSKEYYHQAMKESRIILDEDRKHISEIREEAIYERLGS